MSKKNSMRSPASPVTVPVPRPKKFLRWTLRIAIGLPLLLIAIFVIGVLINLKDEPLSAEAQVLMATPKSVTDPDKNGYFVLSAMDADESLDVIKTGREVTQTYERLAQEDPDRTDYDKNILYKKAPEFTWDVNRCKSVGGICLDADLFNRVRLEAALKRDALLLRRYQMIQQLPQFEEPRIFSVTSPLPPYNRLVQASDMAITQAAFDIAEGRLQSGLDQLKTNDQCLRRMLQQSSTLISRMVTLAMMRRQIREVSELVEIYPALVEQHREALADFMRPMSAEERSFAPVFSNEARLQLVVVNRLDLRHNAFDIPSQQDGMRATARIPDRVFGWFYQHNATVNSFAPAWSALIQDANRPPSEYDNVRRQLADQRKKLSGHPYLPYVHYLSNPVGKVLWSVTFSNQDKYVDYMERSADVDGYLRLVGLQIDIRSKNIAANAMRDYANNSAAQFRSPYDGTPMAWVADKKQLQFVGRQKASDNLDANNIFVVQLR